MVGRFDEDLRRILLYYYYCLVMGDAEDVECSPDLVRTHLRQTRPNGVRIVVVVDLSLGTVRCGHHDHLLAGGGVAAERSPGLDGFVVCVRVKRQQARHGGNDSGGSRTPHTGSKRPPVLQ